MDVDVGRAYSERSTEYAERFGSMTAVHPSDRQLVDTSSKALTGPVIDAGCGPGHWTNYLVERGINASGVDQSADFIAHARARYPGICFELGDIRALAVRPHTCGGVLSWYSLIHHEPSSIHLPLAEFSRVLRPGGGLLVGLLVGLFEGSAIERFDHAVLDAYKWPVSELIRQLDEVGFDVIETHARSGASDRPRPHGAIVAQRR